MCDFSENNWRYCSPDLGPDDSPETMYVCVACGNYLPTGEDCFCRERLRDGFLQAQLKTIDVDAGPVPR